MLMQNGDLSAFDEIFENYKTKALRTAYLITQNNSICEDIVQEAFIQCYNNIKKLKKPSVFRSWFYKILTRTAWKYAKDLHKEVSTENITEKSDELNINNSVEQYLQNENNQMLHYEITALEQKLKTVIILYYFNDLSTKEISKVVGCLEGTVKSRLHTARQLLKKRLELSDQGKGCAKNASFKTV